MEDYMDVNDVINSLNDNTRGKQNALQILNGKVGLLNKYNQANANHGLVDYISKNEITDEQINNFNEYIKQLRYIDAIFLMGAIVVIEFRRDPDSKVNFRRILKSNLEFCDIIIASIIKSWRPKYYADHCLDGPNLTEEQQKKKGMIESGDLYCNERNPYLIEYVRNNP